MLNILFIAPNSNIDYQCHCLFHGLHELNNAVVYTLNDQPFMFSDYPSEKTSQLYGMGFSIAARIASLKRHNQEKEVVEKCVKRHYYDFIIYGSIHRCMDLWSLVRDYYSKHEIICVDGEDWITPNDYSNHIYNIKTLKFKQAIGKYVGREASADNAKLVLGEICKRVDLLNECISNAVVFKRELNSVLYPGIKPISFAIPSSNIINDVPAKTRRMAYIQPGKLETYIYKTEGDYYKGYQESYWGVTTKKAGWDCMRHYEILANGCIPYFPDINNCPDEIMVPFPKNIIKYTNMMYENGVEGGSELNYYLEELLDYTNTYLTTECLAKYVLSVMSSI